jgi:hypothetical protein
MPTKKFFFLKVFCLYISLQRQKVKKKSQKSKIYFFLTFLHVDGWNVDFYELFILWVGSSGGWVRKTPSTPPPPQPPAVGGGRGIIMPLGEEGEVWEAFGDKLSGNT